MTFAPFTVDVPATSANLGPGFDALGLAVDICNSVRVEQAERWDMTISGEGAKQLPSGDRNLLLRSLSTAARRWDIDLPPLRLTCANCIPLSRGLGSSSSAIIAALVIADHIGGGGRSEDDVLQLASELEGHPDNVTPAFLGGVQACALAGGRVVHARVPLARVPSLAVYVPDTPMPTREARRVLPRRVEIHDAVYNISRACVLVAGLASGDFSVLRYGTEDMLHQPPRMRLFPGMPILFHAALEAGAVGVYLSGAGSSVVAFVDGDAAPVAEAMAHAAERDGLSGRPMVAVVREEGARVSLARSTTE